MTDPFVIQLAELSAAHVPRAKWVFVPSHAVGRTLGERIALHGTNRRNAVHAQLLNYSQPRRRPHPHFKLTPLKTSNENIFVNLVKTELKKMTGFA